MAFEDGVKTVSGSVVSIENGADDVPTKSLVVTIPPTISGVSSVTETQTGRNLLDVPAREELTRNGVISSVASDGTITASGQSTGNGDIPITLGTSANLIGGQTYTFSINGTDTRTGSVYVYFAGGSYISINNANHSGTYTPSADQTITGVTLRMFNGQSITFSAKIMLEYGSTAHTYEPYQTPTTYTAQLGRTIYGGQADIVNGTGTETHATVDMGTFTWQYDSANTRFFTVGLIGVIKRGTSGWITDLEVDAPYTVASGTQNDKTISEYASTGYVYIKDTDYTDTTAFKASLSGKYLTYPLATPTDFTFTGQEIPTRLGYNAFWSEQGDTELTYYKSGYGFTSVTVHKETPEGEPVEQTAKLHKIVYGGQADVVKGTCEPKNLLDFLSNIEPTYSGFTITVTSDYGINFSGTGTRTWAHLTKTIPCDFAEGTKLVFSIQENKTYNIYLQFTYDDATTQNFTIAGNVVTDNVAFTLPKKAVSVRMDVALLQASTEYNETLYCMIEKGTTKTDFAPYFAPFTFPPISMSTDEGENTLFANEGDSAITYRKETD